MHDLQSEDKLLSLLQGLEVMTINDIIKFYKLCLRLHVQSHSKVAKYLVAWSGSDVLLQYKFCFIDSSYGY